MVLSRPAFGMLAVGVLLLGQLNESSGQTVSFYPPNASTTQTANQSNLKFVFTVVNSTSFTVTLFCGATTPLTCTRISGSSINPNSQFSDTVVYATGGAGTGVVKLYTELVNNQVDSGYLQVQVKSVSVTPKGGTTATRAPNGPLYSESFTVQNIGAVTETYSFACQATPPVICVGPTPASTTLNAGIGTVVPVSYYTEAPGTSTLSLVALNASQKGDTGTYTVPIVATGVSVTPDSGTAPARNANSGPFTAVFNVQNTGAGTKVFTVACTGSTNVTCTHLSATSLNLGAGVSTPDTATYSVVSVGSGTLSLTASAADAVDGGSFRIPVVSVSQAAPAATISGVNAGPVVPRHLCTMMALGQGTASECGDLRIVHPLPNTRSMNRSRTPVLLYNSQFARPTPLVTALVTVPTTAIPDTVKAILSVNGARRDSSSWSGAQWTAGSTRQIVAGFDDSVDATGIYTYTLEVRSIYGGTRLSTTDTGQIAIVNRQASPFGAGWWLVGLEQLNVGTMVWVGGDGSVRQYQLVPGHPNTWSAPAVDHPDTIKLVGSTYVRYLDGGIQVGFNAQGQHVFTKNRQGHQTTFTYDAVKGYLTTITLPTGTAPLAYQFTYSASTPYHLLAVTAPPIGSVARQVSFVPDTAGFVSVIRDPDGDSVQFTRVTGIRQLIGSTTDRRGTQLSFTYDSLGGRKIARSSLNMGTGHAPIIQAILPQQIQGLGSSSVDPGSAYTQVDGPRSDSADITKIWQGGWGQPLLIMDAHASVTQIQRGDGRWPGLVTEVDHPNGWRVTATYDNRGNVATTTDYGFAGYPTATFLWDPRWDSPTLVKRPEGDSIVMAYDTVTGNRLWQQDGRGSATRVAFSYNTANQVIAVTLPGTPAESIAYDVARGNVVRVKTPRGYDTKYVTDTIGRVTEVDSRLDTIPNNPTPLYQVTISKFDVIDRDTLQETIGPAMGGAPAETIYVQKFLNPNGQADSVKRWSSPDPSRIGKTRTRWSYDPAGRTVAEFAPDDSVGRPRVDSTFYDPAGNVDTVKNRRRFTITMTYDALNHLTTRTLPQVTYPSRQSTITSPPGEPPYVDTIPGDVDQFTYDAMGRVLTANNANARVKRTYFPNGLIDSDSAWIQTFQRNDWTKHAYGLRNRYDRDGHRVALDAPQQLITGGVAGTMSFLYEPQIGALQTVFDPQGNRYDLRYNNRGELDTLLFPASYTESFTYSPDGPLASDRIQNLLYPNGTLRIGSPYVRSVSYWYDAQGKLLRSADPSGYADTLTLTYSGLGEVDSSRYSESPFVYRTMPSFGYYLANAQRTEGFSTDALGNRRAGYTQQYVATPYGYSGTPTTSYDSSSYQSGTGRLLVDSSGASGGWSGTRYAYDSAGNTVFTTDSAHQTATHELASYYAADGSLRALDRRVIVLPQGSGPPNWKYNSDQYRYDALGRRVWVWSLKSCNTQGSLTYAETAECTTSLLRRIVWDGVQELAEVQMPGDTLTNEEAYWENDTGQVNLPDLGISSVEPNNTFHTVIDRNQFFGRVLYTPGRLIDQPTAITRMKFAYDHDDNLNTISYTVQPPLTTIPFWARDGSAPAGVYSNGAIDVCVPPSTFPGNCVGVPWQYPFSTFDPRGPTYWINWQGSLLEGKRDKSGLTYLRNRYYDPATGRFTQEDPLELGGGLNLYGFANSDPINFSDPIGLCPKISVNGKNVTISANLRFAADALPADKNAITSGIANAWKGKHGGYNISVNLADKGAPAVDVKVTGHTSGDLAGAGGDAWDPQSGTGDKSVNEIDLQTDNSDDNKTGLVAAHEFGHVMEIPDEPTFAARTLLMRHNVKGDFITKENVETAIKNCKSK